MGGLVFKRPARPRFYIYVLLFAVLPLVPLVTGALLADRYGCVFDESGAHPCLIAGVDRGEFVYNLGMCGWLFMATVPIAFWAVIIYEGSLFGAWLARKM